MVSLPLPRSADESVALTPPLGFRVIEGLRDVWRSGGSGITSLPSSDRAKTGLRYEKKVLAMLEAVFESEVELSPWFGYRDSRGTGTAQPDAIIREFDRPVVVEIKLQHTPLAWWQLRKRYEPLVAFRSNIPPLVCEITSSYDPGIPIPEPADTMFSMEEFTLWAARMPVECSPFGIFQWRL